MDLQLTKADLFAMVVEIHRAGEELEVVHGAMRLADMILTKCDMTSVFEPVVSYKIDGEHRQVTNEQAHHIIASYNSIASRDDHGTSNKVLAIKHFRVVTGASLADAKRIVETVSGSTYW